MKRICLLIFICFCAFINATGQIRFSKFYDYRNTSNLISDVIILGDTGYFTVSQCVDITKIDTLNFAKTNLYFIRTNQYGDTLSTHVFQKPRFSINGSNLIKAKWGYLLVGNEFDLKKYKENNFGSYIKLWKIDVFGDTISTVNYDIQMGDDYAAKIIKTIENGFAVFGQSCNQIQAGKNCDFYLMKLDSNGNFIWKKKYFQNSNSFEFPTSIFQSKVGDYYMVGNYVINGVMSSFIVKSDINGNQLWRKSFNNFPRESLSGIFEINNKLYSVGSYNLAANGSGNNRGFVMQLDTNGSVNWVNSYGGLKTAGISQILPSGNKVFFVGNNNSDDSANHGQGWLMALNLNGDSLYQRLYNPSKIWPEQIYNINKTSDGFLMSGYSIGYNDSINSQDAWLLKVDSFGCLTPGCQLVGINNIPFSREEIKIYPNPANDKIQINHSEKIISYRIADYTGKLILARNYLESGINVEQLPPGSYIVQVLLEGKAQAFGKLMVTR